MLDVMNACSLLYPAFPEQSKPNRPIIADSVGRSFLNRGITLVCTLCSIHYPKM
jgi:hypothetical protein